MPRSPHPPEWLREALELAYDEVQSEIGRPTTGREINDGHCREFARTALKHCPDDEITVQSYGFEHTWLVHDGGYYDAERIHYGAPAPDLLPFFNHPDAEFSPEKVINGFPDTTE